MDVDFERMSFAELIQLQEELQRQLRLRFERSLALVFSDVVGSSSYFSRFGDVAGRTLQQLHLDLLVKAMGSLGGRIVDTAGDGAFHVYPDVDAACEAAAQLQRSIADSNAGKDKDHRLSVRVGVHWGRALTDGVVVSGDAVNLCARIAGVSAPGRITLSRVAFLELSTRLRLRCRPLPAVMLKGFPEPVEIMVLEWAERLRIPTRVRIEETGEDVPLPEKETISLGRLREIDNHPANDIVLTHPDADAAALISRWHLQLQRVDDGMRLRVLSDQVTEVDGDERKKGDEVMVVPGTVARLAGVLTLHFLAGPEEPHRAVTQIVRG